MYYCNNQYTGDYRNIPLKHIFLTNPLVSANLQICIAAHRAVIQSDW